MSTTIELIQDVKKYHAAVSLSIILELIKWIFILFGKNVNFFREISFDGHNRTISGSGNKSLPDKSTLAYPWLII